MKIISIVVTFNALNNNWLYKCLNSLLLSKIETEIVVIDNASQDDTCNVIRKEFPQVVLFENDSNKGFGAANNQGFEYGIKFGADYFFLLNQDAWIEKNTILDLVTVSKKNFEFGIISPLHYNGGGNALDYNFSNYIVPSKCPGLYSDFVLNSLKDKIYESSFINAAAWLLPIKSLELVGGFSPAFFHYAEDDNYCQRVLFHGLKIGVFPFTKIFHDRENRSSIPNSVFDRNRGLSLKYSNPLITYNHKKKIKLLKLNLLKSMVLRRNQNVKILSQEISFLKNALPKLEIYKAESMSLNTFKFLKID